MSTSKGRSAASCYKWKAEATRPSRRSPATADHRCGITPPARGVGLLQAAPFADEPERDAYLLPPLAIARAWEEPFDYLLVPENPYRGLEPFTAKHAPLFFGRDADIESLTARAADSRWSLCGTVGSREVLAGTGRAHPGAAAATSGGR